MREFVPGVIHKGTKRCKRPYRRESIPFTSFLKDIEEGTNERICPPQGTKRDK